MKKNIINGKEIEKLKGTFDVGSLYDKINELIDALDEKKEECDCTETICCPKHPNTHYENEPKSTLREDIKEILCEAMFLKPEYLDLTGNRDTDKIISLFKETLLKEIEKTEMPGYQDEGVEHAHAGYVRALEDIINLIKDL